MVVCGADKENSELLQAKSRDDYYARTTTSLEAYVAGATAAGRNYGIEHTAPAIIRARRANIERSLPA